MVPGNVVVPANLFTTHLSDPTDLGEHSRIIEPSILRSALEELDTLPSLAIRNRPAERRLLAEPGESFALRGTPGRVDLNDTAGVLGNLAKGVLPGGTPSARRNKYNFLTNMARADSTANDALDNSHSNHSALPIFVHIPKTGGRRLTELLANEYGVPVPGMWIHGFDKKYREGNGTYVRA